MRVFGFLRTRTEEFQCPHLFLALDTLDRAFANFRFSKLNAHAWFPEQPRYEISISKLMRKTRIGS